MECVRLHLASATIVLASALLAGCTLNSTPPVTESPAPESKSVRVGECPWAPDGDSPPTDDGFTDPREVTESIALTEDRFWQLIESIPSSPAESDFAAASSSLAGCSLGQIVGFDARLTLALYDLDGPKNLEWFEANDPLGIGFASDDVFLYARCASVLGGHENWSTAVADGTLAWGEDEPDTSGVTEQLLYVGLDAALAKGLSTDEYFELVNAAIPLSYESGSNKQLWGDAAAI